MSLFLFDGLFFQFLWCVPISRPERVSRVQRRVLLNSNADSSLNEGYMDPKSHLSGSRFFPGLRRIDSILLWSRVLREIPIG